jgi:hypothetical protein
VSDCATPLAFETLVAYWAGDLPARESDELEEHLFSCDACTKASARVAAITEVVRALVPPVVTRATVDALRARGHVVEDNVVTSEARSHAVFRGQDFVIHHLTGLALEDAERVAVSARAEETGELMLDVPSAPFDAAAGEVLIACRRHFAAFPPNVVFEVTTSARGGATRSTRFVVEHTFDAHVGSR